MADCKLGTDCKCRLNLLDVDGNSRVAEKGKQTSEVVKMLKGKSI